MTNNNFERKNYSREEINILVAEQLKLCIEPICREIGVALEALQKRIVDLEIASNAMINEMKEWKERNSRMLQ
jgi:hypothetical protein